MLKDENQKIVIQNICVESFSQRLALRCVQFLFALVILVCANSQMNAQTYNYEDIPTGGIGFNSTSAPCSTPLIRNIFVGDSFNILDVKLGFNAIHTWRGDIVVALRHPDGTQATVINRVGGSIDNYDVDLDDSGGALNDGTADNTASPFYDRSAAPSSALSVFDGKNSAGTWQVRICDGAGGDNGTYNRARLTLEEDAPIPGAPVCGIRSDKLNNWTTGAFNYNELNIDGSGVNMSVAVTGETGQLSTIQGGTFNGVAGLDLRTQGFLGAGATFTYTFSQNLSSVDFDIGHINTSGVGGGGDKFTITAKDTLGNTIFPTFTTSGSSYTANSSTGVVNATGSAPANLGIRFEDADLITEVKIVWDDCDTCGNSFHGMAIGEMDICIPSYDYGDAPDTNGGTGIGNYQTLLANNGPSHRIDASLAIGTIADNDTDGFGNGVDSNGNASDDDSEGTADEGLISFPAISAGSTNYSLNNISVTNTGSAAILIGWIDFDRNGSFDEDERAMATVSGGASSVTLSWSTLPGIIAGTTYARFRLARSGDLSPGSNGGADEGSLGPGNSGEVEDYQLLITGAPSLNLVKNCNVPADCTTVSQLPNTELTYEINFTNSGTSAATSLLIVDAIPENTDYKLGTAVANTGTTGLTFSIEFSSDYNPLNPGIATWTYTPVSGAGGADGGYDRNVKAIRWRVTAGSLSQNAPNNTGGVSFVTKIR